MSKHEFADEQPEIIYIPNDEGEDEEFEVIMKFEVDNSDAKYMMVVPVSEDETDVEEVYAFRYEEDGDELKLYTIEDEEEWAMVEETFHTLLDEMDEEADAGDDDEDLSYDDNGN